MSGPVESEALDFERADMAPEAARMSCGSCSAAIASTYYGWGTSHVCPACHERLSAAVRVPGSFLRAFAFGGAAAALGAGVYYGIAALTNMEFGLIAIFVGMGVGKAVRAGAGFEKRKRYRALAILLSWVSITATYIPGVLEGMETKSVALAAVISFIAPVLMLIGFENIMGLVILGIGVYEAWKLSAAPEVTVQGPFTLEPATSAQPEPAEAPAAAAAD